MRLFRLLARVSQSKELLENANFKPLMRSSPAKKMDIMSLSQHDIAVLTSLDNYKASIVHLEQNQIKKSLFSLQIALSDAQRLHPYSIEVQSCIINRISILQKILNQNELFLLSLEKMYLRTLCSKGMKSIQTHKHLTNYLIALLTYKPEKACGVLDYLRAKENLATHAIQYNLYDGVLDIAFKGNYQQGIEKLTHLPEQTPFQKYSKWNNIAWMKSYGMKIKMQESLQKGITAITEEQLRVNMEEILKMYFMSLIELENDAEEILILEDESEQSNKASEQLLSILEKYISNPDNNQLRSIKYKESPLKNPNSHIVAMNVAHLLYNAARFEEGYVFLKLSLEQAIKERELERVGLNLVLLGGIYDQKKMGSGELIYLTVLNNMKNYSIGVVKETLSRYSFMLLRCGRLIESEEYYNQAEQIEADLLLEGLILPQYDFSY